MLHMAGPKTAPTFISWIKNDLEFEESGSQSVPLLPRALFAPELISAQRLVGTRRRMLDVSYFYTCQHRGYGVFVPLLCAASGLWGLELKVYVINSDLRAGFGVFVTRLFLSGVLPLPPLSACLKTIWCSGQICRPAARLPWKSAQAGFISSGLKPVKYSDNEDQHFSERLG